MAQQQARIGLWGAVAIGVGGMVGGGIFAVLGLSVAQARGAAPLAFAIAGAVALLTAHSYAGLSGRYPSRGGTVAFLNHGFGDGVLAGSGNVFLWAAYVVMLALYASAFGAYGAAVLPGSPHGVLPHVLATGVLVGLAGLNFAGAGVIARAESYVVAVKIAILLLFVVAGATAAHAGRLAPSDWPGAGAIVAAGMLIFAAYEGFELIANAAEDVRDPGRTLPRAYFTAVGFVVVLYILVAAVAVGSVTPDQIRQDSEFVLAVAARPVLGAAGFIAIGVAAMLSTASAINATLYGSSRLTYIIARSGQLPAELERKIWTRPVEGMVLTTAFSLVLADLFDVGRISFLGSAAFLLIFFAVNVVAVRLMSGLNRLLSFAGALASAGALAVLLDHGRRDDPFGLAVFGAVLAGAFAIEGVYRMLTGRRVDVRAGSRDPSFDNG